MSKFAQKYDENKRNIHFVAFLASKTNCGRNEIKNKDMEGWEGVCRRWQETLPTIVFVRDRYRLRDSTLPPPLHFWTWRLSRTAPGLHTFKLVDRKTESSVSIFLLFYYTNFISLEKKKKVSHLASEMRWTTVWKHAFSCPHLLIKSCGTSSLFGKSLSATSGRSIHVIICSGPCRFPHNDSGGSLVLLREEIWSRRRDRSTNNCNWITESTRS